MRRADQTKSGAGVGQTLVTVACLSTALCAVLVIVGCETNSFMDPSKVGNWEMTPKTMPILNRLDVIDEPEISSLPVTQVQPGDLLPTTDEYVIGSGDLVTVTIFELIVPGTDAVQTRRVDETGAIRLPVVESVHAAGRSPSQLENDIVKTLDREGILKDATVSVVVQESRQNTYSVIGEPFNGSTAFGTYVIPKPDFRLLEALALARGVPGRTKKILIFRQTALSSEVEGSRRPDTGVEAIPPAEGNPVDVLDQLGGALEGDGPIPSAPVESTTDRPDAPPALAGGLESGGSSGQWIRVGDRWVEAGRVEASPGQAGNTAADALSALITQRIIEVPYENLINGDMRYNLVIRAGDVIRIPDTRGGFVYLMGEINRPGAYTVPGEADLTLMQLIASGGNLSAIAVPSRVDLVRRIGNDRQAIVRLNLKKIFEGNEPDIFLKANDLINIGTNFPATPLAVFRNGLRATYGFGFVVDRNFENQVFGRQN